MGRLEKFNYDLSDGEKRDLITLIQQGKPLPEKYHFLFLEDKREVELVWNGKTRDVCTTVLRFQSLEHIDEPRTETKTQGDLFDGRDRQSRRWKAGESFPRSWSRPASEAARDAPNFAPRVPAASATARRCSARGCHSRLSRSVSECA